MTTTTTFARHSALDFEPGPYLVRTGAPATDLGCVDVERAAPQPAASACAADACAAEAPPIAGLPRYGARRIGAALGLVLLGAVLYTAVGFMLGVGDTSVGAQNDVTAEPVVHVVEAGDTLWSIASSIDTDGDPRDTVDRLADRNGGVALQVGQHLVID